MCTGTIASRSPALTPLRHDQLAGADQPLEPRGGHHEAYELSRVIVDSTVQQKAIAHPTDSRLLEVARDKLVQAAKDAGIALKQTFFNVDASRKLTGGGCGQ